MLRLVYLLLVLNVLYAIWSVLRPAGEGVPAPSQQEVQQGARQQELSPVVLIGGIVD